MSSLLSTFNFDPNQNIGAVWYDNPSSLYGTYTPAQPVSTATAPQPKGSTLDGLFGLMGNVLGAVRSVGVVTGMIPQPAKPVEQMTYNELLVEYDKTLAEVKKNYDELMFNNSVANQEKLRAWQDRLLQISGRIQSLNPSANVVTSPLYPQFAPQWWNTRAGQAAMKPETYLLIGAVAIAGIALFAVARRK